MAIPIGNPKLKKGAEEGMKKQVGLGAFGFQGASKEALRWYCKHADCKVKKGALDGFATANAFNMHAFTLHGVPLPGNPNALRVGEAEKVLESFTEFNAILGVIAHAPPLDASPHEHDGGQMDDQQEEEDFFLLMRMKRRILGMEGS